MFMTSKTNPRKHLVNKKYTNYMPFLGRVSNTFLGYHRSSLYFNIVKSYTSLMLIL